MYANRVHCAVRSACQNNDLMTTNRGLWKALAAAHTWQWLQRGI